MERWNYENLTAKTMQEIALTYQQVFKLFTFSLFVAGIRLFHSSKLRNLNISCLYLVFELKFLLLLFCSASLENRRKFPKHEILFLQLLWHIIKQPVIVFFILLVLEKETTGN
jgi:hypothetical protein